MSEVHLCLQFKSGTYVVQFRYGARLSRRLFFFSSLSSAVRRWPQAVLMAYISSNVRLTQDFT